MPRRASSVGSRGGGDTSLVESVRSRSGSEGRGRQQGGSSDAVVVALRVRPLASPTSCSTLRALSPTSLAVAASPHTPTFTYDHLFWSHASQEDLYNDIGKKTLSNALSGFNASLIAYGQTGSGKTHSMFGAGGTGLVPRLINDLFDHISSKPDASYTVEVSFYQIYLEKVTCLLSGRVDPLKVREHPLTGPYVEDLLRCPCASRKQVARVLNEGHKNRKVAQTRLNSHSSRSHALIGLTVASKGAVSKMCLVDLAGSERVSRSGSQGVGITEASAINQSLSTLGKVIAALAAPPSAQQKHVPYRDSLLTWLLRESLGGNSKTTVLATVSAAHQDLEETLSTLRYAAQAKRIKNRAVVNDGAGNKRVVAQLKAEIRFLQEQLYKGGDGVLQQKLVQSQKLMEYMTRTWDQKWAATQALLAENERRAKVLQEEKAVMSRKIAQLSAELHETRAQRDRLEHELKTPRGRPPTCPVSRPTRGASPRPAAAAAPRSSAARRPSPHPRSFFDRPRPVATGRGGAGDTTPSMSSTVSSSGGLSITPPPSARGDEEDEDEEEERWRRWLDDRKKKRQQEQRRQEQEACRPATPTPPEPPSDEGFRPVVRRRCVDPVPETESEASSSEGDDDDEDSDCDPSSPSYGYNLRLRKQTRKNTEEAVRQSELVRKRIDDDYRRQQLGLPAIPSSSSSTAASSSCFGGGSESSTPIVTFSETLCYIDSEEQRRTLPYRHRSRSFDRVAAHFT